MANPFPFVAGDVLTAAELNGIGEAWTSYTPTVTQGVGVTATIQECRFTQINKIVFIKGHLTLTSAGTAGSSIRLTYPSGLDPVNITGSFAPSAGAAGYYDASTTVQYNMTVQTTAATIRFFADGTGGSNFGQFPALTAANGDILTFFVCYEVA
jgi:hypothetical protein